MQREWLGTDHAILTRRQQSIRQLLLFFGGTYALTWSIVGLYIIAGGWAVGNLGPMRPGSPAFYLAVAAPSISALALTARYGGLPGVFALLRRLVAFRVSALWAAVALLGYPILWLLVALAQRLVHGHADTLDLTPWLVTLPALLLGGHLIRDGGALGEELGWRGYALPRLLDMATPRTASLILGFVWALWHLPAFFVSSLSQSAIDFGPYVLNVVAFSVLMTALYVRTQGNVLWAGVVPHMMFNAVPRAGIEVIPAVTIVLGIVILISCGPSLSARERTAGGEPS